MDLKKFKSLLKKEFLSREEIISILQENNEDYLAELYHRADRIRNKNFGNEVHLRAVLNFSNHCQEECFYCSLREQNFSVKRYRMSPEEILEIVKAIANLGIKTIVLQSGEDSYYDTDMLAYLIYSIKQNNDVAITLNIGERNYEPYKTWKYAGADRYILKFETSDEKLFTVYKKKRFLNNRINKIKYLKNLGYQVGSGNIIGLPNQTLGSIADDVLLCKELNLDMAIFDKFIPQQFTPYQNIRKGDDHTVKKVIAIARLLLPDVQISTSENYTEYNGESMITDLNIGANILFPDFTPRIFMNNKSNFDIKKDLTSELKNIAIHFYKSVEIIGRKLSDNLGHSIKLDTKII